MPSTCRVGGGLAEIDQRHRNKDALSSARQSIKSLDMHLQAFLEGFSRNGFPLPVADPPIINDATPTAWVNHGIRGKFHANSSTMHTVKLKTAAGL
jgi:hypothetical protein